MTYKTGGIADAGPAIIIGLLLGLIAAQLMPAQTHTQPASAQQTQQATDKYDGDCDGSETAGRCQNKPFDHTLCQYPDRTTNPPDGCDNSDPCDPANVKGGSGECVTQSTTQERPQPVAKPNQCEGK